MSEADRAKAEKTLLANNSVNSRARPANSRTTPQRAVTRKSAKVQRYLVTEIQGYMPMPRASIWCWATVWCSLPRVRSISRPRYWRCLRPSRRPCRPRAPAPKHSRDFDYPGQAPWR